MFRKFASNIIFNLHQTCLLWEAAPSAATLWRIAASVEPAGELQRTNIMCFLKRISWVIGWIYFFVRYIVKSICTCSVHEYELFVSYVIFREITVTPKHIRVFKHPFALINFSFRHYTSVHNATRLLSACRHHMFWPYTAIIRCLLKLFTA